MSRSVARAIVPKDRSALTVFRRWNSYSPVVPGSTARGGGYYLRWRGTGIAVDPGFDFLRNLDEHGLGPADIDVVIITHNHIDHTADLDALLTLIYEYNDHVDDPQSYRRVSVYYGSGCKEKFSQWLQAMTSKLPSDKLPVRRHDVLGRRYGDEYEVLDLTGVESSHPIRMEILHTAHKEIGGHDESVGVLVRLLGPPDDDSEPPVVHSIGFGSDTGWQVPPRDTFLSANLPLLSQCDVLVLHLGTIDVAELLSRAEVASANEDVLKERLNRLAGVLNGNIFRLRQLSDEFKDLSKDDFVDLFDKVLRGQAPPVLIKHHMGIAGIQGTLDGLLEQPVAPRIAVISEFGLELGSYRHEIAAAYNRWLKSRGQGERLKALTGDIGLKLILSEEGAVSATACKHEGAVLIECTYCHSTVCPDCITEKCIKYRSKGMFYNCPECFNKLKKEYESPYLLMARESLVDYE